MLTFLLWTFYLRTILLISYSVVGQYYIWEHFSSFPSLSFAQFSISNPFPAFPSLCLAIFLSQNILPDFLLFHWLISYLKTLFLSSFPVIGQFSIWKHSALFPSLSLANFLSENTLSKSVLSHFQIFTIVRPSFGYRKYPPKIYMSQRRISREVFKIMGLSFIFNTAAKKLESISAYHGSILEISYNRLS